MGLSVGDTLRRGVLRTVAMANPKALVASKAMAAKSVGQKGFKAAQNNMRNRAIERGIKK